MRPDPVAHDFAALAAVYAEADAALGGWTCEQSTDCCHFGRTGREPYLWPNEWALLERAIAQRGARPGALPIVGDERRCPLLGADQRCTVCTVYAARPFGCRTFYCGRAVGPLRRPPRDAIVDLGRRVAALAERADPECEGPRPLTRLLAERRKPAAR